MICEWCHDLSNSRADVRALGVHTICDDCVISLLDDEAERRGVREQARSFTAYWEGNPTREDMERQDLKDAGRIP